MLVTLSTTCFASYNTEISTNSAHFLDPQVIPAKTEVYKFIFGILTSNVKVIMWSHKEIVKRTCQYCHRMATVK